ncbi:MAG: hypothetical protein JOY99_05450 [Sphingomonadaceae bacterium]|nr:hypothetical protein [Sphingomonadaceae bacterium]
MSDKRRILNQHGNIQLEAIYRPGAAVADDAVRYVLFVPGQPQRRFASRAIAESEFEFVTKRVHRTYRMRYLTASMARPTAQSEMSKLDVMPTREPKHAAPIAAQERKNGKTRLERASSQRRFASRGRGAPPSAGRSSS